MKHKWLKSALLTMIAGTTLAACSNGDSAENTAEEAEVSIVTSFYPMYEFTSQVAGDRADVTLMVSGNADPHSYEPSAQDVAAINEADMFVYSSPEMEYWAEDLFNSIENEDLKIVSAAEDVNESVGAESHAHAEGDHEHGEEEAEHNHDEEEEAAGSDEVVVAGLAGHYHTGDAVTLVAETGAEVSEWQWSTRSDESAEWTVAEGQTTEQFEATAEDEEFQVQAVGIDADGNEVVSTEVIDVSVDNHENEDPHSWLDPVLVQEQVDAIRDALIEIDPEGEEVYTENAAAFKEELQQLDQEFVEALEGAENREFVVQHQAFGHIARRYNLEQIAIGGLSTEVEPSPSRIAEIGDLVEEHDVPVIYYQQGADSSIAQTVATETGTETAVLHDLESLSEELQSKDLGYIDAMKENIEALKLSIN